MAISKDQKQTLVADLTALLSDAKLTVFAEYQGISVAKMQELRAAARAAGVKIKIVKNRLVRVALGEIAVYQDTDTTGLTGQLLYAVSDTDEVAPASVLAQFAKAHDLLKIQGGISAEGKNLSLTEVAALAELPSKDQLIAEVVAMLISPVHDTVGALSGNLHGLLDAIANKSQ
jgi:large subunit ribosomal protein L10